MNENKLVDLSKQFAVDIVNLCTEIKENRKGNALLNQLLRSGTSIGANIHEANYAASKADFINKFQIALKECYESDYWLGLFKETKMITENNMLATCGSDFHHYGQECLCGILTKEPMKNSYDVANVLKSGNYNMAIGNYIIKV